MLESLITSKTRIKLLLKLFLNNNTTSHLRAMSEELGESSNSIRLELNRFTEAGLVTSEYVKNKRRYRANMQHPLYNDIHNILFKMVEIDKLIDLVIQKTEHLDAAYLTGSFAAGLESDVIEVAFVGENLDDKLIRRHVETAKKSIQRKIFFITLTSDQMDHFLNDRPVLLIWKKEFNGIPNHELEGFPYE